MSIYEISRRFLSAAFPIALLVQNAAADPAVTALSAALAWHDVTTWGVEGRAWVDQPRLRWFDRLPAAAEKTVSDKIWVLSRDSAGMMVRFETDSPTIRLHYRLSREPLTEFPFQTADGSSGADLYARDQNGRWRWVQVAQPRKREVDAPLLEGASPEIREYALYLPLHNGVDFIEIGVSKTASFKGLAPRALKPIVFYGTSINHGYAASRPGMTHIAILGRRFDRPVVNLGFAGNGRMDAAVGELLTQVAAAVYVIDCLPNMTPKEVTERCRPLVMQMRAKRPFTPIVLVEDRRLTNAWILPRLAKLHDERHAALKAAYDSLRAGGVKNLFYVPGDHLLGDDDEATVDTSHPSDLGFMRQADAMQPFLAAALRAGGD